MPNNTRSGDLKIYPGREIRAVDMAEVLKALTMFEGVRSSNVAVNGGIIQGCTLAIPSDNRSYLRMSPGRMIICGRLAEFKPESGNYIYLEGPSVSSVTSCVVVAVCNLALPENPFYVSVVTGTGTLDTAAERTTDELFNTGNGLRYLRLATVDVSPNGSFSNLKLNSTSSAVKTNKAYVDEAVNKIKNDGTNGNLVLKSWIDYLRKASPRYSFFATDESSADGLTIKANTLTTFKFRKEFGSETYLVSGSGSQTIPSSLNAQIVLTPDGTIKSQKADTHSWMVPGRDEYGVPSDIGSKYVHLCITGVILQNASSNPSGLNNLLLHAFYTDSNNHVCAEIKNTGSSAAKFKLIIRSLYILDITSQTVE